MSTACTWRTRNGASCPFPATSTGHTYGPGRWLCHNHVECSDVAVGDMVVYDELNRRKLCERAKEDGTINLAERIERLQRKAWERAASSGALLYQDGWNKAKQLGVAREECHEYACAHMVQALSRPDVNVQVIAQ